MNETFGEHIRLGFQRALPLISSILLLLISYIPINVSFMNSVKPSVSIICVYFWLLHRPDLFNLISVCILALVEDVLSIAPFGSNLFALLLFYVLVTNLAKYFNAKPFVFVWYSFGALSFVVFLSKWLLVSIYYGQFIPFVAMLFSFLMTMASYPILGMINVFIQNTMIKDEA